MANSEISKEIQLDRINNKVNFLRSEIKKTVTKMNNIHSEIVNPEIKKSNTHLISMGNLESKRRKYDDHKNHLLSCITSLESEINKIPVNDEPYSQEFIESFLEKVNFIENNRSDEVNALSTQDTSSNYVKTKSGIIVPRDKELKQLRALAGGYVCRAETLAKLATRIANEYSTIYFYGGKGQPQSESVLNALIRGGATSSFYAKAGRKEKTRQLMKERPQAFVFDCSGLIYSILWGWKGDASHPYGGSCLGKGSPVGFNNANGTIKACSGVSTNFSSVQAGEIVWNNGHVGIAISTNQAVDCNMSYWGVSIRDIKTSGTGNINSRPWAKHGKMPHVDYTNTMTDNLGNGWIAGPGNGGGSYSSGISGTTTITGNAVIADYGYVNGLNMSDLYESDNYYGFGEKTEFIERTTEGSVTRLVLSKQTSVATLASSLSMSPSNLIALNPSLQNLASTDGDISYRAASSTIIPSGVALYVPTSTYTSAKELATSTYNTAAVQIDELNSVISSYKDEDAQNLISSVAYTTSSLNTTNQQTNVAKVVTSKATSSSSKTTTATNSVPTSTDGLTPMEVLREYKSWTRVFDTGPYKDYTKARIIIIRDGKTRVLRTVISPTAYSENYSNGINLQQTTGGWFMARHGESPVNLTIQGVMLDTDANPEKHLFMKEWQEYFTDKQNSNGLFYNKSVIKVQLEGVRYEGTLNSISFSKDAKMPSLYNFSMSFSCVTYKVTRNTTSAMGRLGKRNNDSFSTNQVNYTPTAVSLSSKAIASGVYKALTKK